MSTIQDVLEIKGGKFHSINLKASALEATVKMNRNKMGSLIVMDEGSMVGIITERDILNRVIMGWLLPEETKIHQVMTTDVISCCSSDEINEVYEIMIKSRINHMVVLNQDREIIGLVTMGDIRNQNSFTQQSLIGYLNDYIYGHN